MDRYARPLLASAVFPFVLLTLTSATASPISEAAERAEWPRVNALLKEGASVSAAQPGGMTALHWAVFHGRQDVVAKLLAAGADPQAATRYQVRPLTIASRNGEVQITRALLQAGADANAALNGKETVLMITAGAGEVEIIKLLLASGAEVNATEANSQTALMWAASAGNTGAVETLLAAGADHAATSRQGFTALHFAAREGRLEVVGLLLDAGAEVDAPLHPKHKGGRAPREGMSPMMLAVESAHFEVALELIRRGANPNDQRSGYTPLHAVSWVRKANLGDNPSGDPEPRGSGDVTSLEFVRRLVDAGARVNEPIKSNKSGPKQLKHEGCTPVLFAARTADLPLVRLLVELDANPHLPNRHGCTPLMACAGVGVQAVDEEAGTEPEVLETVEYLLSLGAEVNTIDGNHETPMHGAAYRNFPRVVELLARSGADPAKWDHKNKSGWTPMRIAEGYRPGSFKPHPPTQAALRAAMSLRAGG